jgi:23S rRNA (uridine2552-2'-O)-methyltransferase
VAGRRKRGGRGQSVGTRTQADGRAKRLKTAKGRGLSSTRWLTRQLRDPYVAAARSHGYRSRAAFKLIELDDRFHFLKPGASVIDLGAAPGGWSQVATDRIRAGHPGGGRIVAVDITEMEPLPNVHQITLDFLDPDAEAVITAALDGKADVVLTDMAAPATGHTQTDHLRIMALLDAAYAFARTVLKPGGVFLGKVLRGGTEKDLLDALKRDFRQVRHVKPPASRKESAEIYVIATGFRGAGGGAD